MKKKMEQQIITASKYDQELDEWILEPGQFSWLVIHSFVFREPFARIWNPLESERTKIFRFAVFSRTRFMNP